jgi:hypothetical protein
VSCRGADIFDDTVTLQDETRPASVVRSLWFDGEEWTVEERVVVLTSLGSCQSRWALTVRSARP